MRITHNARRNPRDEFQHLEKLRVEASDSLAEHFTTLKSLAIEQQHFGPEGTSCQCRIKYTVNLEHAKSVFRVACYNPECVRGDFDLSEVIVGAVRERRTTVSGEVRCQGWRNRAGIDRLPCHNLLRYKLSLGYRGRPVDEAGSPLSATKV